MNNENDTQELMDEIEATPKKESDVTVIREKAKELRDTYLQKADLENQLSETNSRIIKIERDELVNLFAESGISSVSVDPDGNHPGFVAERGTVIGAKIPDEKRKDAIDWFERSGNGDLVKAVVSVIFGMQEHEKRLKLLKLLSDNGFEFQTDETIHHMTLKAFVKRELKKNHIIPRELLGVYMFDEVKIKEGK